MKKVFTAVLMCVIALFTSACNGIETNEIYGRDAEIAKSRDQHSASLSVYSNGVENELSMYADEFIGAQTLWTYDADSDGDITLRYELLSRDGKVKLAMIAPDGAVSVLVENTDNTLEDTTGSTEPKEWVTETVSLKKGKNRLKIVSRDNPSLRLHLHVDAGELYDPD